MSSIDDLLENIPIPRMARVAQSFARPKIESVEKSLREGFLALGALARMKPGSSVAVAVGSRGISELPELVGQTIAILTSAGMKPFIVPAMGSHGGATGEGQRDLLSHLGVTEENAGAPIRSSMDVRLVSTSPLHNLPVYVDENALSADGIVIINRIKAHPAFRGTYESGLVKMAAIGLGKQRQAELVHNLGAERMGDYIEDIGLEVLRRIPLIAAVAVVENAFHEISRIEVLASGEVGAREPELLEEARNLSARFLLDRFEVLVIDEIGKEISGAGFDTTIVGRYSSPYIKGGPDIKRVAILDITDKSNGYGGGLGMADFTTRRAADKFDPEQTYPNTLTSTFTEGIKIPMTLRNEKQAIQSCIKTCNTREYGDARMIRIRNTLCMEEIMVSENMLDEVRARSDMKILGEAYALDFDEAGNLADRAPSRKGDSI